MEKAGAFPYIAGIGGAYFNMKTECALTFGVEVEADYPRDLLYGHEVTRIPQSAYMVFNFPKYSAENHGDAVRSAWGAQRDYDINAQGCRWDFENAPVFENDDYETGYTLWFPVICIDPPNKIL